MAMQPSGRRIQYTESGQNRLDEFYADLRKQVDDELRQSKFVPGDDLIEVTGSDVDELKKSMRITFLGSSTRRFMMTEMLTRAYLLIAIVLAAAGVFYPYLDTILQNPMQFILIGTGVGMGLMSLVMNYYIRMRRRMWHEREYRIDRERDRDS